ncbi:MAG TPA: MotA/TolQ/ExbB proton channel family protein [Thermoanaerobaculia bacterium]|jgi:biopolymer transport protein TolQ|nr:MotA/TolQ/ExbB proton channel family protein [Thermoanaerobaculia bacterium]
MLLGFQAGVGGGSGGGHSLFEFFSQAGPVAKLILGLLALMSLLSWAVIFGKLVQLSRADGQSARFLEAFHRSSRFSEVNAQAGKLHASPLVGIFQAGYAEIDSQIKHAREMAERPGERRAERAAAPALPPAADYRITSLTALERSLARAISVEIQGISRWTPLLATTAAAGPFIGLFGTVWGIMVAFRDIGMSGSTSIVAVAPGISEALINTAAGLAAAIPALIGYNYFVNRIRRLKAAMEDFVMEFLNLAERNFT